MLDREGYDALTRIYDASVNPGRWKRALDATAEAIDARAVALLIRRLGPDGGDRMLVNSPYLKFTRTPWGIYYGLRLSRLQEPDWTFLSHQPPHRLTLDTEIGPTAADLDMRADYAMLRKRLGVRRRIGVRLNGDRVWFDAMSIAYGDNVETVGPALLAKAQPLLPHLTKAVEIGRTFAVLRRRYTAALTALDHVAVGLAVALPSGEIVVENAEMKRVIALGNGLAKTSAGHLASNDPDCTARIAAAIRDAADTARGEGDTPERLFVAPRLSEGEPFLIDVAPLADSKAQLDGDLQGALITVIDPERVPRVRIAPFAMLYGLTPAEAEVCTLMLHGGTAEEIAEMRDTAPVTVKNQIAAILQKTGTNRRADLIRLVLRVLPPIE